jgi:hypothetical protein
MPIPNFLQLLHCPVLQRTLTVAAKYDEIAKTSDVVTWVSDTILMTEDSNRFRDGVWREDPFAKFFEASTKLPPGPLKEVDLGKQ